MYNFVRWFLSVRLHSIIRCEAEVCYQHFKNRRDIISLLYTFKNPILKGNVKIILVQKLVFDVLFNNKKKFNSNVE